jgi:hypothetical protein
MDTTKPTNTKLSNEDGGISVGFSELRTTVHNYRFFYYLANELAYSALQDKDWINAFRYSMGVVIFSYTTIEVFINHISHSKGYKTHELFSSMSNELKYKVERFSLNEKVEFAFKFSPDAKVRDLDKGEEPFQSFDIMRQLRNFLIHYIPNEEVIQSDNRIYLEQLTKLELRANSKFAVDDLATSGRAFVYRCFNKHCALWAFNVVQPFLDWFCDNLNIERPKLEVFWDLSETLEGIK